MNYEIIGLILIIVGTSFIFIVFTIILLSSHISKKVLEIVVEPQEYSPLSSKDIKHLDWIYHRLIVVHKEDPSWDYMLKFKEIIDEQSEKDSI